MACRLCGQSATVMAYQPHLIGSELMPAPVLLCGAKQCGDELRLIGPKRAVESAESDSNRPRISAAEPEIDPTLSPTKQAHQRRTYQGVDSFIGALENIVDDLGRQSVRRATPAELQQWDERYGIPFDELTPAERRSREWRASVLDSDDVAAAAIKMRQHVSAIRSILEIRRHNEELIDAPLTGRQSMSATHVLKMARTRLRDIRQRYDRRLHMIDVADLDGLERIANVLARVANEPLAPGESLWDTLSPRLQERVIIPPRTRRMAIGAHPNASFPDGKLIATARPVNMFADQMADVQMDSDRNLYLLSESFETISVLTAESYYSDAKHYRIANLGGSAFDMVVCRPYVVMTAPFSDLDNPDNYGIRAMLLPRNVDIGSTTIVNAMRVLDDQAIGLHNSLDASKTPSDRFANMVTRDSSLYALLGPDDQTDVVGLYRYAVVEESADGVPTRTVLSHVVDIPEIIPYDLAQPPESGMNSLFDSHVAINAEDARDQVGGHYIVVTGLYRATVGNRNRYTIRVYHYDPDTKVVLVKANYTHSPRHFDSAINNLKTSVYVDDKGAVMVVELFTNMYGSRFYPNQLVITLYSSERPAGVVAYDENSTNMRQIRLLRNTISMDNNALSQFYTDRGYDPKSLTMLRADESERGRRVVDYTHKFTFYVSLHNGYTISVTFNPGDTIEQIIAQIRAKYRGPVPARFYLVARGIGAQPGPMDPNNTLQEHDVGPFDTVHVRPM